MTAHRYENWATRLDAAVRSRAITPWKWGSHDCGLFAADLIEAMTGTDVAKHLRGYKTARGAAGRISRFGGFTEMMRDAASRAGLVEIAPAFAGRGDVCVLADASGFADLACGVVELSGRAVLVAAEVGFVRMEMTEIITAWRIE